jgi:2-(1,2-epoxy-1,2-dihydrophenyl)acetyl-CoA isomerase
VTVSKETLIGEGDVLADLEDGVVHLRLNRPEAGNGLHVPMLRAFYDALMVAHGDPRTRAVLLTGEGKIFCGGGDVKEFASRGEQLPEYLREATTWLGAAASAMTRLEAPVVTAVHGFAAGGGGMGYVLASDLVVAGESAKFLTGATRVGMAPDAGSSVTLSRIVGLRKAMELALTNPILTAQEALELGIVTRVVPDDELLDHAHDLARELAAGPTKAFAATKRLLWDGLGGTVEQALPAESRVVSELSGTADAREGLAAVLERRAPRFTGK